MSKQLTKWDIIALVIGSVIGWGAFYLPGQKFLAQSGVINTAIGFVIGWGLIYFIQVAYHVMMHHHAEKGGEFTYVLTYLGKVHGFIAGWSLVFCYLTLIPLNATAVPLVIRSVFPRFALGELYGVAGYTVYASDLFVSILIIFLFYRINKKGLSLSMTLQKVLMSALFIIVCILMLGMFWVGNVAQFKSTYIYSYQFSIKELVQVISIIPFLFVGFDIVPQVLTEIGFDKRFAIRMTIFSTGIGVLVYNALNILTALVYTPRQAYRVEWASGQAVLMKMGKVGFFVLAIALFVAIVGGINGFMIGSSRIVSSLAEKQLLPQQFSAENEARVPVHALRFVSIISAMLPFLGRVVILSIVDVSSLMAAVIYAYVAFVSGTLAQTTKEKFLSWCAVVVALSFIGLLVFPGSPSQLSQLSFGILGLWAVSGVIYFILNKKGEKYEKNRI